MASRGRPVVLNRHEHILPDANEFKVSERYECETCEYKWVVTKSPIGNKNFWRELGK